MSNLNTAIASLNIGVRAKRALKEAGKKTLKDIAKMTAKDLLDIPSFGNICLRELQSCVANMDDVSVAFAGTPENHEYNIRLTRFQESQKILRLTEKIEQASIANKSDSAKNLRRLKDAVCIATGFIRALQTLPKIEREVLIERLGLESGITRTLDQIGQDFNVERERIRQIEEDAFQHLQHPFRIDVIYGTEPEPSRDSNDFLIESTNLSARAKNVLSRAGITRLDQLMGVPFDELVSRLQDHKNCGEVTANEIRTFVMKSQSE